jgi:hypothetical protein
MTTDQCYTECVLVLKQELELLERIQALQVQVKNAVIHREWADFEDLFGSLAVIGDEFETLDLERVKIFAGFAQNLGFKSEGARFYSYAARLPEAERRELSELYRRIKIQTLETRLGNESLTEYLGEIQTVVSGFLEAVFPDRRGKIYTRRGTQVAPDMRSLVLNQSF